MKYDLHTHTNYSKCSSLSPQNLIKAAYKKNLDGIAVTDHNSTKGALIVKKINTDPDFEVIIGNEIRTNYGDVLVYYPNEEIKTSDFFELQDKVRSMGAMMSIAHPYRLLPGMGFKGDLSKIKDCCIEAFNSRSVAFENVLAKNAAKKHHLVMLGGSDAHFSFDVGNGYTIFDGDLRSAVKKRKTQVGGTIRYGWLSGICSSLTKLGILSRRQ